MKIIVTQDHINQGKCSDARQCAVALAIREAIGERLDRVRCSRVDLVDGRVDLPREAREWIFRFDTENKNVKPFEFELAI